MLSPVHGYQPPINLAAIERCKYLPLKLWPHPDICVEPVWFSPIRGAVFADVERVPEWCIQNHKILMCAEKAVVIPDVVGVVAIVAVCAHEVVVEDKSSGTCQSPRPVQKKVVVNVGVLRVTHDLHKILLPACNDRYIGRRNLVQTFHVQVIQT
jgi:hypothetical protein